MPELLEEYNPVMKQEIGPTRKNALVNYFFPKITEMYWY